MQHELKMICETTDGSEQILSIYKYYDSDPDERTRILQKLSKSARGWRAAGYPSVTIIEDEREELPLGLF